MRKKTNTINKEPQVIIGTIDQVNAQFSYILSPEVTPDIIVYADNMDYAIHGDTVKVILTNRKQGEHRIGKVVEIIKRAKSTFIGIIEVSTQYSFVKISNKKYFLEVFVHNNNTLDAENGERVIVQITKWHNPKQRNPIGKVFKVLRGIGKHEVEMHSIMAEFDLPFSFDEKILQESESLPEQISLEEIKKRKDFRKITTFTIDPDDAKDFDDALSFQILPNGNYEVGVHIADVSHYVLPNTLLDAEAYKRGNSVYLVDRTIPMLPERISNFLCSLRPLEDKLTYSVVFEMDKNAKIKKTWIGKTIIHSQKRFSYEDAQLILETKEGIFSHELNILNNIAHKLTDIRYKNGAINFETIEIKFKLDETGKPIEIYQKIRKDAHRLIEEFMLLANKTVAESIATPKKEKKTFAYRIHDNPPLDKMKSFSQFIKKFGYKVDMENKVSEKLNTLISKIEGSLEQNVITNLAIRSMSKAKYTCEPLHHFGLAFKHYTHFTSPIRRYPDLLVHRMLFHYQNQNENVSVTTIEPMLMYCNDMEKKAAEAERASIKFKQVELMSSKIGQEFQGIVSGITERSIFVELDETKSEGMLKINDMKDDEYLFEEKNYRIVGKRHKKIITIGDTIKVQIAKTDIIARTIDLKPVTPNSLR
ncbi:MAG: ribonuclease R [Chitinophagaceae bacterium]|nr:ribonuclease R [Chitinophagaceae bacterium]